MPRDLPDWGAQNAQKTIYEITDVGEAAVRLGSPVSFDRLGDVFFMDTFEHGLGLWGGQANGAGAVLDLSMRRGRTKGYSARMVASSDGVSTVELFRDRPFPVLSPMGFECSFNLASSFGYVEVQFNLYDGTEITEFRLRYVSVGTLLQYQNSAGVWVDIAADASPKGSFVMFNTIKLVVDAENDQYARVTLNDTIYPLAAIDAQVVASAAGPKAQMVIFFVGDGLAVSTLYFTDPILTYNEPLSV